MKLSLTGLIFIYLATATKLARADTSLSWLATPFNTQSIPLHVKSPCNSMWAPQSRLPAQAGSSFPRLWDTGLEIKTWFVVVRVDGISYEILGGDTTWTSANQTSVVVTPIRSTYLLNAGPVIVNMTFLSPVEPDDLVKMSSPFSYMYFTFTFNDTTTSHDVQIYSDITGEWISGDSTKEITWSGSDNGTLVVLQGSLASPEPFQINGVTCQDGTVFYAMQSGENVQWQIGPNQIIRENFRDGVPLNNSASPPPSPISILDVLAISVNVGTVQATTSPVIYTVGIVRDPVIQYINGETLVPYYRVRYDNVNDLIGAVLQNFSDSVAAAQNLDLRLAAAGQAISGNYSDLLSISTRQAFGAFDLTVSLSDNNKVNASDVKAFARNFGSLGSGGINAPDVIYAAMPAYIYLWPDLLRMLLLPLLEYQDSPSYINEYAAQDIGVSYPNATGDSSAHNMQVEQSANMIIIALAHAQATGDGSLLSRYYDQFNSWANFLVNNTLILGIGETSSTSDGISEANQANLALKGIIGLGAMAKISSYVGRKNDNVHFQNIAVQYALNWTELAVGPKFISLTYGSADSGIIYNLYADKLLQTNLINDSVYQLQTDYYKSVASNAPYGIPLNGDGSSSMSRTDWTMFAVASVTDDTVGNQLVSEICAYASVSIIPNSNYPFTVVYNSSTSAELAIVDGVSNVGGINSASIGFAQGAMFAPLALSVAIQAIKPSESETGQTDPTPTFKHRRNLGAIIGGAVGGVVLIISITSLVSLIRRRRQQNHKTPTISPYRTGRRSRILSYPSGTSRDRRTSSSYDSYSETSPDRTCYEYPRPAIAPYELKKTRQARDLGLNSLPSPTLVSDLEEPEPETIQQQVAELRREVQRMRMEQHVQPDRIDTFEASDVSPPSYDTV